MTCLEVGMWRYELAKRREAVICALVWHLPREIIQWAVVRAYAHGTTGRWGQTHPDTLGYGELLRRWETPDNRQATR